MSKLDSSDLFTLFLYEKWAGNFLQILTKEQFAIINGDALKVWFYEYLNCQYDLLKTRSKKSDREEVAWLCSFKNEEPEIWPTLKRLSQRYKYSRIINADDLYESEEEISDCDSDATQINVDWMLNFV